MSLVEILSGFAVALRASIAGAGLLVRRRPRTWRVLVLGGGATECALLDRPDRWPAVARRFLQRRENLELLGVDRARVKNLGRSRATCRRMTTMLERAARNGKAVDAVVLEVGAEDLEDWLGRGPAGEDASCVREDLPDARTMIARLDADLRELIERARARARTVVILRPSWLVEPHEDYGRVRVSACGAGAEAGRHGRARWSRAVVRRLLEQVDRRVAHVARETGVAEVDPKLRLEPSAANYRDELRFTSSGCAILGEAVAQALLREREGRCVSRPALREQRHADVA